MLTVLSAVLYTAVVLIAILLIGLVLVQPAKSGGFGSAFGGVGESMFGAQAMSQLSKVTVWLLSFFFIQQLSNFDNCRICSACYTLYSKNL